MVMWAVGVGRLAPFTLTDHLLSSSDCIKQPSSSQWAKGQLNVLLALYLSSSSNLALNLSTGWCISQPHDYHLPCSIPLFLYFLSTGGRYEVRRRDVYKETGKKNYNLGCVWSATSLRNYTPYVQGLMSTWEGITAFCVYSSISSYFWIIR